MIGNETYWKIYGDGVKENGNDEMVALFSPFAVA